MDKRNLALAIMFVIIVVLIGTLVCIKVIKNNVETIDRVNNQNNQNGSTQENSLNVQKDENKAIELSESDRVKYNKYLNSEGMYLMMTKKINFFENTFDSGAISDDSMLTYAVMCANESGESKNSKNIENIETDNMPQTWIKEEYAKTLVSKTFDRNLDVSKITSEIKDGKILVMIPTGFGLGYIPKVEKLVLNEVTGVYSLYFVNVKDNISLNDTNIIKYNSSDVYQSYILKYKESGNNKLIMSITNVSNSTINGSGKTIEISTLEKIEYNKYLNKNPLFITIMLRKSTARSGEFSDDEMVYYVMNWAQIEDEKNFNTNATVGSDGPNWTIKIDYLKSLVKKHFNKELNIDRLSADKLNDKLILSLPMGFGGITVLKVNKLEINENSTYSLYFDEVGDDELKYDNYIKISKPETITYNEKDVKNKFILKYKYINDIKEIISLVKN